MNNERRTPKKRMMGGPPMPSIEKAKNFSKTFKTLLKYLKPYRIQLSIIMLIAIGGSIFSIVGPEVMGRATTEVFEGLIAKVYGTGGIDFNKIWIILIQVLILYGISSICTFVQGFVLAKITNDLSYKLRKNISEKLNKLPMNFFDKNQNGEILSRITNDIDTLGQNLNQALSNAMTSIFMIIGILFMMLKISVTMTLTVFTIMPVTFIILLLLVKFSQKYFAQVQEYLGNINAQVEETYAGHNIVKVFNTEEEEIARFEKVSGELFKAGWKSQFISGIMMPMMNFIGNIGYVIVSLFGGWLVIQGKIQVGDIQAFITYVRTFTQQLAQGSQITSLLQSTVAAAERVFEFLEEEEEVPSTLNPLSTENIEGNITFENVQFGYNSDKIIINNFSAEVKKGQKIAIVGPTGAGKTTIVKLLMRFYDINSGKILIDGKNINDFDRSELRSLFGMVLQDTWLFNGTIRDNIAYSNMDASEEEVVNAAKASMVDHFISTLPSNYAMEINEEANNISQGQKQLLTIARVILHNPKILILDEATSSVDTRTEVLIQQAMDKLMEGRTSFVIAHRLSTIRNADTILVMNDGDIVEVGSHEELLKKGGFYANLYNSQFENSIE